MLPGLIGVLAFLAICFLGAAAAGLLARQEQRAAVADWVALGQDSGSEAQQERPGLLRGLGRGFDSSPRGERIRLGLERADLHIRPSDYVASIAILGAVLFFVPFALFGINVFLCAVAAYLAARYVPKFYLNSRKNHYIEAFNAQLVDVASLMGNSLRAGLSIPQAMEAVARETPPPAGREFARAAREAQLGKETSALLNDMGDRLPSEELGVLVTAILVQRSAGGNLPRMLSAMTRTMAERKRLAEEIKTATSEVRFSGMLVAALPIGLVFMLKGLMPGFIDPLFSNPIGWAILGLYFVIQIVAFFLVRRISTIRV